MTHELSSEVFWGWAMRLCFCGPPLGVSLPQGRMEGRDRQAGGEEEKAEVVVTYRLDYHAVSETL